MLTFKNKNPKGFTLLELVIVIAIIGILAVIVLPSMLNALAKARDAKRMTELRGIQTFLTITGIDSTLRYPESQTNLVEWYGYKKERAPNGLTGGQYHYQGINCDTTSAPDVVVGGTAVAKTCSTYQLWTNLEVDAAALRLDADLTDAAAYGTNTGPCVTISQLSGGTVTTLPTGTTNGTVEACTTTSNCVFDLVP